MRYANFKMKLACLAVILGALWQYQDIAAERAEEMEENSAAIAEIEAYNAVVEDYNAIILQTASGDGEAGDEAGQGEGSGHADAGGDGRDGYADGTYQGEGSGFGGALTVSVTIQDGLMAQIEILSADGEDAAYLEQAKSVLDDMIQAQSADVDTVSGATFSSGGLIEATANALEKAVE